METTTFFLTIIRLSCTQSYINMLTYNFQDDQHSFTINFYIYISDSFVPSNMKFCSPTLHELSDTIYKNKQIVVSCNLVVEAFYTMPNINHINHEGYTKIFKVEPLPYIRPLKKLFISAECLK